MAHKEYIYTDADDFRTFVQEYANIGSAVQKVNSLTDEEILDLVNSHIDEAQFAELISEAQEAALTEIEAG